MQINCDLKHNNSLEIVLTGLWNDDEWKLFNKNKLFACFKNANLQNLNIKADDLQNWNTLFVSFIFDLYKKAKKHNLIINAILPEGVDGLLRLAFADKRNINSIPVPTLSFLEKLGMKTISISEAIKSGGGFLKTVLSSLKRFFVGSAIMRKSDFLFVLEDCSFKAFGIVSLICFMVGLIFGFVGAMQLKLFGAQIFVASLVMLAMVRVMGAVMTGIIMAGRTGSAYAASIGTMQVNEEIDALKTMGINVIDFLLLPRMLALIITMPILTVFADVMGVFGGAAVGVFMLDLAPSEYWKYSVEALSLSDFLIGILHGAVFGVVIAICGCYYGIKSGKNADSVGKAATNAVVASIVWIIVSTAVLTVIFEIVGV